jgi:hypothetical protein
MARHIIPLTDQFPYGILCRTATGSLYGDTFPGLASASAAATAIVLANGDAFVCEVHGPEGLIGTVTRSTQAS